MAFAQQSTLRVEALELTRIFSRALTELRQNVNQRSSIDIQIGAGISHFMADEDALFRVLHILTAHAELENGKPQNFILSAKESKQTTEILIELSFSSAQLCESGEDAMFEPFALAQSNTFSAGLGMATARSIMNQMKGSLRARAFLDHRITFEMRLPTEPTE